MPWMVVMFGVLVVRLGVVSIGLVILQPVAVDAWCTLCYMTASTMLIIVISRGQLLRLVAARAGVTMYCEGGAINGIHRHESRIFGWSDRSEAVHM